MNRRIVVALIVTALFACDEDPTKASVTPTAPTLAPAQVSGAEALAGVSAKATGSKVCFAYLKERNKLQLALKKAPSDTTLQQKAKSLALMLADACN